MGLLGTSLSALEQLNYAPICCDDPNILMNFGGYICLGVFPFSTALTTLTSGQPGILNGASSYYLFDKCHFSSAADRPDVDSIDGSGGVTYVAIYGFQEPLLPFSNNDDS